MNKKIRYIHGMHESFRTSGTANINCLKSAGFEIVENVPEADIVILHVEPWHFPAHIMMEPEIQNKYTIAYAVWETDILPNIYRYNLELVDEIWTASDYCAQTLKNHFDNVHIIPHTAERQIASESELDYLKNLIGYKKEEFYFYTITDILPRRKNLPALLRTLPRVIENQNARYILKTDIPVPQDWFHRGEQFIYLPSHLPAGLMNALHQIGNCYVSAHCSEGWGMCMSEAMAHGNLVVATGYSGNMDFMTAENSLPVDYSITPAQMNNPWPSEGQWASIDEIDFAAKLTEAMDNWGELAPLRRNARTDMERFGKDAVAQLMKERLVSIGSTQIRSDVPEVCISV